MSQWKDLYSIVKFSYNVASNDAWLRFVVALIIVLWLLDWIGLGLFRLCLPNIVAIEFVLKISTT